MPATLKFGDQSPDVAKLVDLLTKRGCAPVPPVITSQPKFGRAIENMVLYFQMTHQPWCAYFAFWVLKEIYGKHLLGEPVAAVWSAYKHALEHKPREPNDGRTPTPGDAFVILHGDDYKQNRCTGHIGFLLQVADDGKSFNTIEGNCGNRVKVGTRAISDPKLRGFINIVGDRPTFKRGSLRGAQNVGKSGMR
ncbi:MAG: CHAP domain-containing protein [Gemmatimonadota bacterium]|nr:MAG: CHAP domain-containing protein [Gemmatimonadota bacterium]